MSAIKIRVAQGLKAFGLHPQSEVQDLQQELTQLRERLEHRNQQLEEENTQLQEAQARLEDRNERLRDRNERLRNRNERLSAGTSRKFQDIEGEPLWHRRVIGGRWEEIGQLQLDFLRERGLEPHHRLLDVGCGSLRGGVRFIPYLEAGRYFGVDRSERLLDAGRTELEEAGLKDRRPHLVQMDDFGFEHLDETFDYALANSLFTHLPLNSVLRCLVGVDQALRPGGVFYATFFENGKGKRYVEPLEQGDGFYSFYDTDPFHYTRETLEWACEKTGLMASYIGEWGHPRHQMMMEFRKTDSP